MPTVSEQLTELITQKKSLAANINEKGITASENEKFNTLVPKVAQIEELRGEERTLDVLTKYNDTPESIVSIEYPESKNLFDIGKVEDYEYPIAASSTVNLSIENNSISGVISVNAESAIINTKHKIKNGTYTFSSTVTITGGVTANYRYLVRPYDNSDNVITNLTITNWEYNKYYNAYIYHSGAQKQTVTVPNTVVYWQYGLVFLGSGTGTIGQTSTYTNIQLELGSTATAYEPYSIDKKIDLQLSSKNLIPYPYAETTKTINGITFTVNADGSITVNGTATANAVYELQTDNSMFLLPQGTYTLSGCPAGGSTTTYFMATANGAGISYDKFIRDFGNGVTVSSKGEKWKVSIRIMSGTTVNNLVFKPQLELGSNATPYTPYISDFSASKITAIRKNLILLDSKTSVTNNGITYTFNASDGTITANGTFTNINTGSFVSITNSISLYPSFLKLPLGHTYTISGSPEVEGVTSEIRYCNLVNGQPLDKATSNNGLPKTFTTTTSADKPGVQIQLKSNGTVTTVNNVVFKPQIEYGNISTTFECREETTYTADSTGKISDIQNYYPVTNILTDNTGTLITVKGGAYKEILPSTGNNGITKVYQEVISSDIIENLKPENIKKGITILGITGTYASEDFVLGTSTLS